MKLEDLILSNVHMNEDEYICRGAFTLSSGQLSMQLDLVEFENGGKALEVKETFGLTESEEEIKKTLLNRVISHSSLSSRDSSGEDYQEDLTRRNLEESAVKLDRA